MAILKLAQIKNVYMNAIVLKRYFFTYSTRYDLTVERRKNNVATPYTFINGIVRTYLTSLKRKKMNSLVQNKTFVSTQIQKYL